MNKNQIILAVLVTSLLLGPVSAEALSGTQPMVAQEQPQSKPERISRLKKEWREFQEARKCLWKKGFRRCTRAQQKRIVVAVIALAIMVGAGYYYLGRGGPRITITDKEFSDIISQRLIQDNFPLPAQEYLKRALTQRDDDALAVLWMMRSVGAGRGGMEGHFGNVVSSRSPLLQTADRINYDLAKNVLKLAVDSSHRTESNAELIQAIMGEKGNDPLFQIASLFARVGYFLRSFPPLATDVSTEARQILSNVTDPLQIDRLKRLNSELRRLIRNRTRIEGPEERDRLKIVNELEAWVAKH